MLSSSAALDQLIDVLGVQETRSLVELYLEHTAAEITRLRTLSFETQLLVVHALKGSSAQVGAKLFVAQCRAIESQLKESRILLTDAELTHLQAEFASTSEPFRIWLEHTRPA